MGRGVVLEGAFGDLGVDGLEDGVWGWTVLRGVEVRAVLQL